MNTHPELQNSYPTITETSRVYKLVNHQTNLKELFDNSNLIIKDNNELDYLWELKNFILKSSNTTLDQIEKRLTMIKNTKSFDIEKVKELPDDIINEIKSYLEPEIIYTRRLSVMRNIISDWITWIDTDIYLNNVPKKIILNLKDRCNIYPITNIRSKDLKQKWSRMIFEETLKVFSKERESMRIDKQLYNQRYEYGLNKQLDKWYDFFLYMNTFKKHRAFLESNIRNNNLKLIELKNKNIVVN